MNKHFTYYIHIVYYITNTPIQRGDEYMKQWNGLLKKEWLAMKGWFYGSIITQACIVLFLSFFSTFILEEVSLIEIMQIFSGLVGMMLGVLLPITVLLVSLNKEMQRPDIWLHSTASTVKLFGVKMLFGSIIGFVNLVLTLIIVLVGSRFSGFPIAILFNDVFQIGTTAALMFFLLSIFIMCIGLFLGVLYQLLKPVVKGFSGPIVVMIFLFISWLQARLAESAIYTKMTQFGQLNNHPEINFNIQKETFFIDFATMDTYTGELLVDFALAFLFFLAATVLFEKKVRI